MIQEVSNYLFIQRELIHVFNSVFCDYTDNYFFVPPNSYIEDRFDELMGEYLKIESTRDKQMFEYIDQLPLVSLGMFRSLGEQYDESIRLWRGLKESIKEDAEYIKLHLPNDYCVSDRLRVLVYELRDALKEHSARKQALLDKINNKQSKTVKTNEIIIDKSRSVLLIGINQYSIDISIMPFKFLDLLIKRKGLVIEYSIIAKELNINAYHIGITNADIKREVQELKRELLDKLKQIKVTKEDIVKINNAIISVRQTGYKLEY